MHLFVHNKLNHHFCSFRKLPVNSVINSSKRRVWKLTFDQKLQKEMVPTGACPPPCLFLVVMKAFWCRRYIWKITCLYHWLTIHDLQLTCSKCDSAFKSVQALKSHMNFYKGARRQVSTARGLSTTLPVNNANTCDICGDNLPTPTSLKVHMLTHKKKPWMRTWTLWWKYD